VRRDRWVLGLGATGLALALIAGAAHAQAPKAEPKAAPAKTEKKAVTKKAPSACQGLDEKACGANTTCSWIKATKTKAGVERKAYCRLKTAPPKKAGPAKK
jgi:hypothetical protein